MTPTMSMMISIVLQAQTRPVQKSLVMSGRFPTLAMFVSYPDILDLSVISCLLRIFLQVGSFGFGLTGSGGKFITAENSSRVGTKTSEQTDRACKISGI